MNTVQNFYLQKSSNDCKLISTIPRVFTNKYYAYEPDATKNFNSTSKGIRLPARYN
jgi:hypothetical protein